jgi:hypothetical protein
MIRMTCRAKANRTIACSGALLSGACLSGLLVGTTLLAGGCSEPVITPMGMGDLGSAMPSDLAGQGPKAFVRLGHFVVGLPAFDMCIKGPNDTTFTGPLMRMQTNRSGGVSYASISTYLNVVPATYTVRAVPGSATSCATSLGGVPDLSQPPLAVGQHYIVIASGDLSRPATFKFGLIQDDLSTVVGQARLRFINAAPDLPSADLGFGSGAQYMAQLTSATYGSYGLTGGVQYLTTAPLSNGTVAVRQSGMNTDALVIMNKVNLAAATATTSVVSGIPNDQITPLSLLVCNDSAPAQGGLSSCTQLP